MTRSNFTFHTKPFVWTTYMLGNWDEICASSHFFDFSMSSQLQFVSFVQKQNRYTMTYWFYIGYTLRSCLRICISIAHSQQENEIIINAESGTFWKSQKLIPRKKNQSALITKMRVLMGWWLLRLSAKILALLRLSVNFLQLRLTKKLKINFFCSKS